MKVAITLILSLTFCTQARSQQSFSIWPGKPRNSEQWNWKEQLDSIDIQDDPLVYNVTNPTLIYFPPDPGTANGTSVIICPGGSFCYLHIATEGIQVAKWLNGKGVAAFVLKYRLVHSETEHPMRERMSRAKDSSFQNLVINAGLLAIEDGKQAVRWVRNHTSEFCLRPDRVGIMGFSAGGAVAVRCGFDYSNNDRPDFLALVYAYVPPSLPMSMEPDAPPLFVAAASDDELHLVPMSVELYNKWLGAGRSAEIHIYSKGGHGFGMNKKYQPSDTWIERLGDWLNTKGFLKNEK